MALGVLFFVTSLLVGGSLLGFLAVATWRHRSAKVAPELAAFLVAASIWVFGALFEHLAPTLLGKLIAVKTAYIGIVWLPVAVLATVLAAIQAPSSLRRVVPWLYSVSIAGVLALYTNGLHGLFWTETSIGELGGLTYLEVSHGPLFWVINLVCQAELAVAAGFLVWGLWRDWRPASGLIYAAFVMPWIFNGLYITGVSPLGGVDITPLGLVFTGVCLALAFRRHGRLLSIINVAHHDVLNYVDDLVLIFNHDGEVVLANRAAHRLLEIPALPAPPDFLSSALRGLVAKPAGPLSSCDVALPVEGSQRIYDARFFRLGQELSGPQGMALVMRDVTHQRASEDELRVQRRQLRQIIDLIPHSIFVRDVDGRYLLANDTWAERHRRAATEIEGQLHGELFPDATGPEMNLGGDAEVIVSGEPTVAEEWVAERGQQKRLLRTTRIPFVRSDSESPAIAALSIDVTDQRLREEELHRLASTDPLTRLSNRRHFLRTLRTALAAARVRQGKAALLFLDLDRFKMVNDLHGHPAGDEVLREVGRRIVQSVREADTVGRFSESEVRNVVSRFGGDEFVVLLPDVEQPRDVAVVARRLLRVLGEPLSVGDEQIRLGVSLGIAMYPDDGEDADALVRHSDQALTEAKRSGRGRFGFYTTSLGEAEERRSEIEASLRDAIEGGELDLHYQPIWRCAKRELVGGEALLRWHNDKLGHVSPGEFIPVAEQSGLVCALGLHSLRALCGDVRRWQELLGASLPRISSNLSALQVLDPSTAGDIRRLLSECGVAGTQLEFELTEGSILSRDPAAERTLKTLRALGATLALDDFGTGYSSLSHLRRFRFERIKIDRSFVSGIGENEGDEELTRAVIALSQRLGMETVAEGVETEEQLAFLQEEGCDYVQGFLLGRPCHAREFTDLLRAELPQSLAV